MMIHRFWSFLFVFLLSCSVWAVREDTLYTLTLCGKIRGYVLYVPDSLAERPALVFSLHGAAGHATDRSPFRTTVADEQGCIVVYPQGDEQFFPVFGGRVPGWNASGEPNADLEFFKAIIEEVALRYPIDRSRIYCCGFSNGGMMTYSNAGTAADIFAAFASISGFPLNEFHHRPMGVRPVPFLHIHGKNDGFVKYACMPVICDNMVARNGCFPVPEIKVESGKYRRQIYKAGPGGFPFVYYEIDGMGHSDFTDRTPEGNSALTMWNFMSRYALTDSCDSTLKWRLNVDTKGFRPEKHGWTVSSDSIRFSYGTSPQEHFADNNVYPALTLKKGDYMLCFEATGDKEHNIHVCMETLDGHSVLFYKSAPVGQKVMIPFSVFEYTECRLMIVKTSASDKFLDFSIHTNNKL